MNVEQKPEQISVNVFFHLVNDSLCVFNLESEPVDELDTYLINMISQQLLQTELFSQNYISELDT